MIHTRIEPAFEKWAWPTPPRALRSELIERVNANAERLGTGRIEPGQNHAAVIGTGHQAFFYHPGILAKDIAANLAAERFGATPLHLVVDQDVHEALSVSCPVESEERLSVRRLGLAHEQRDVPTGFQPSVTADWQHAADALPARFTQTLGELPPTRTLAQQVTAALARLRSPYAGNLPVIFCSDLPRLGAYQNLVRAMLDQPRPCAASYNQAVAAYPHAGIGPLAIELDRVELPLWVCRWNAPRLRVFADLSDSTPRLIDEDDEPIGELEAIFASNPVGGHRLSNQGDERTGSVLPRALTMTGIMRSALCERFIHGLGGWTYDRITEHWWRNWRGEELSPMALVTADMHLDFHVPHHGREVLERALWHNHHLPHNLDRELSPAQLDGQAQLVDRKAHLLDHMNDDRNRWRRRQAFNEIHAINDRLAQTHPQPLERARDDVQRARRGLANQRLTQKRDWPFVLYPPHKLDALRDELDSQAPRRHEAGPL